MYQNQHQQYQRPFVGQAAATAPVAVVQPSIDFKKVGTSLVTLSVLGSAAYVAINAARNTKNKTTRALGWVGGVGSALVGLAALSDMVNQPKITSTLLLPFNLPQA